MSFVWLGWDFDALPFALFFPSFCGMSGMTSPHFIFKRGWHGRVWNGTPYSPQNSHGNGKVTIFKIVDTSSNGCFPIVMLVFGGVMDETNEITIYSTDRLTWFSWRLVAQWLDLVVYHLKVSRNRFNSDLVWGAIFFLQVESFFLGDLSSRKFKAKGFWKLKNGYQYYLIFCCGCYL